MLRLYVKIRRYIINHSFAAFFLSHGFIHIIAALIMICLCVLFYSHSIAPTPIYKQIDVEVRDSFNDLEFLDIQIATSSYHEELKGVTSGLAVVATVSPPNVSDLKNEYDIISKRDRYILDTNVDGYPENYIYLEQCPIIGDTTHQYRVIDVAISTPNAIALFDEGHMQGDVWTGFNPNEHYILDSLSSNYVSQIMYIDTSNTNYSMNGLTLWGDFLNSSLENPYYHFSLNLTCYGKHEYVKGRLILRFHGPDDSGLAKCPLNIIQCIPDSYTYSPTSGLVFPIQDVVQNGGIYFLAENISKKTTSERDVFFSSILLGASLAFLIDIIINLIIKWRNLAIRKNK